MISDDTINIKTAGFWCIFADSQFVDAISKVKTKAVEIANDKKTQATLNEAFVRGSDGKVHYKKSKYGFRHGPATRKSLRKSLRRAFSAKEANALADAAIDIRDKQAANMMDPLTPGPVGAAIGTAIDVGIDHTTGEKPVSMVNLERVLDNVEDVATDPADAQVEVPSTEDGSSNNAVKSLFGKAMAGLASFGIGKAALIALGAVAACIAVPYLWMRAKVLASKWFNSGKEIAKCKFSADGDNYVLSFNVKDFKWKLAYDGVKMAKYTPYVSDEDVQHFEETKFAKKFTKRCIQYFNAAFSGDNGQILNMLTAAKDSKTREMVEEILKNKKMILKNMSQLKVIAA